MRQEEGGLGKHLRQFAELMKALRRNSTGKESDSGESSDSPNEASDDDAGNYLINKIYTISQFKLKYC